MVKFRLLKWTFIFSAYVFICPVFPLPVKHDSVLEFKILSKCTKTHMQCDKDSRTKQLYSTWCNLSCPTGLILHCINNEASGKVYICRTEEQCPPGYYRSLIVDSRNDLVVSQYGQCPPGYYRPERADCYIPCRQHSVTPYNVIVYREGSATSDKIVYCDYTRGYFTYDINITINMDSYGSYFCDNVMNWSSKSPLCLNNQMPLPNGTCVYPCESGYYRDDSDLLFICKPNISISLVSNPQNQKEYTSIVSRKYHNVTAGTSSWVTSTPGFVHDIGKWSWIVVIVLSALLLLLLVVFISIMLLMWCSWKRQGIHCKNICMSNDKLVRNSLGSTEEKEPLSQAQSDGSSNGNNKEERKVYKVYNNYNCDNLTIVRKAGTVTCPQFPEQVLKLDTSCDLDSLSIQPGAEEPLVDVDQTHIKVLADNTR